MSALPTGTVTFLFTDIEGSTALWERHPAAMKSALARHDEILGVAIDEAGGAVFKTVGDAFCGVFAEVRGALDAAIEVQRALHAEDWSAYGSDLPALGVRMGLHTGVAELRDRDYYGPPLNRTARLMSAGHGGQVLLSLATQQLVRDDLPPDVELRDLGIHRLKDLRYSEHIFQVVAPGTPVVTTPPDTAERLDDEAPAVLDAELLPSTCPYRGLHAFREEDARFFFGREAFTERLLTGATGAPMTAVIGPSGSGKSSVVFAGLVPRLRSANGTRWTVLPLRPGPRPFHALAGALLPLLEPGLDETDALIKTGRLAAALESRELAPSDLLARIGQKQEDQGRILLVADQFEELYTLCPEERTQRAFQDVLFESAFGGGGSVLALGMTLRADFMGHALAYRPFADAVQDHNVVLGPMNREELAQAIEKPAELQGRAFESGLVERIIDDVGEKAGRLPLLEFALTKLWDGQRDGWLTHDAYEEIGRVEGAVARHADAVYEGLGEEQQEGTRRVFVQLVQPGEGTEDTRRLASRTELEEQWGLVQTLADERLVTTGQDADGRETAEVIHEALIRSWGRLVGWMKEDRQFRTWQERLRFAMRQWQDAGRDEGALLRGVPLAEAEGWIEERHAELNEREIEFIRIGVKRRDAKASVERERLDREVRMNAELRRRAVFLMTSLAIAAMLAVIATIFGIQSNQAARSAEVAERASFAREISSTAMRRLDADPELSLLLALEAISTSQRAEIPVVPESRAALVAALEESKVRSSAQLGATGNAVDWSPDGRTIAVGTRGEVVLLKYEKGAVEVEEVLRFGEVADSEDPSEGMRPLVTGLSYSPDGSQIVIGAEGYVRVWDVLGKRWSALVPTLQSTGDDGPGNGGEDIIRVEFSPDGEKVLYSSLYGKYAGLLEPARGITSTVTRESSYGVRNVAFDPKGDHLGWSLSDGTVVIADAQSLEEVARIDAAGEIVEDLDFSPIHPHVVAGGQTEVLQVWDTQSTQELAYLEPGNVVRSVSFSPDGRHMLYSGGLGMVGIEEVDGDQGRTRFLGHKGVVRDAAWSPDGRHIATVGRDESLRIWSTGVDSELPTYKEPVAFYWGALGPREDPHLAIGMLVDGNDMLVVLDAESLAPMLKVVPNPGKWIEEWVPSQDNRQMAAISDSKLWVWRLDDAELLATAEISGTYRWLGALEGEGEFITIGDDSVVRSYRADPDGSAEALEPIQDRASPIEIDDATNVGGAMSPNHDRFAVMLNESSDESGAITVWDARTLEIIHQAQMSSGVKSVAFSSDGTQLIYKDAESISVLSASNGEVVRRLDVDDDAVGDVWISPDGTRILGCGLTQNTKIWSISSGEEVLELFASGGDCSYSLDGRWVTTVSDGLAYVWDAHTAEEVLRVENVQYSEFGRTGESIYVISKDGFVRSVPVPEERLLELANSRVTRRLTDEECRTLLHLPTGCRAESP